MLASVADAVLHFTGLLRHYRLNNIIQAFGCISIGIGTTISAGH